ncbi:spore germination protein [Caldalkalibacillus salinus]|uniref:spore germination protein n=1 Tax=Caldalkalibacillus salinus TaxID=2803787 RepID=UPI001920FE11|nr:spore germination protein [Caldalkalibacillus salinus]
MFFKFNKTLKKNNKQQETDPYQEQNNTSTSKKSNPQDRLTFKSVKHAMQSFKSFFHHSNDLVIREVSIQNSKALVIFFENLVDKNIIDRDVLKRLIKLDAGYHLEDLIEKFPLEDSNFTSTKEQVADKILRGWVYIYIEKVQEGFMFDAASVPARNITSPEVETHILGPQVAFAENLSTNISLIRNYIRNPDLVTESIKAGEVSKTEVTVMYVHGLADPENVHTVRQRIKDLDFDGIIDSNILVQLIEDNSTTIFPQISVTERPDTVGSSLLEGKVAILVDGSPFVVTCPNTFIDFFSTNEDSYIRWNMATFIRMVRLIAMALSVLFTPMYVASVTYHYEVIPQAMLVPLAESRSRVPFPPLFEALLLEFIIELLREAGARLPAKVGQTMGIVGGIVIGQAAVQAGFTSNILIMIVALGALASFTAPSYLMGTAIRVIRFPMIIMAGLWGFIGMMFGVTFLLLHLIRQTSLGRPYLAPVYPLRISDLKDSIVRLPWQFFNKRPVFTRNHSDKRTHAQSLAKEKDIDE